LCQLRQQRLDGTFDSGLHNSTEQEAFSNRP
jgi:hypothetical protein